MRYSNRVPVQDSSTGRPESSVCAAEQEPTLLRNVFLCNGDKYSAARFGREQIIASIMKKLGLHIEAHGHKFAMVIEQEPEVHLVGEPSRLGCNASQISQEAHGVGARVLKLIAKTFAPGSLLLGNRRK